MTHHFLVPIMAVIACSAVSAQRVTEFRQPGDVLRFEVKLDGADASKVKTISLYFGLIGQSPKDQPGFDAGFSGGRVGPTSLNTFIVEAKIPENVVTGDYKLYVNAQAEVGSTQYEAGNQFQMPPFHIKNSRTLLPPTITVTELH